MHGTCPEQRRRGQRGNALLITMVVITVVGTVGFGVSRIAISSLRQQNRLEDSANAYQAATAGIEDGLLRWRFNKDTEVPAPASGNDCVGSPTTSSKFYTRVNLTQGTVEKCVKPESLRPPSANEIVYDLKVYYKKDPGEEEVVTPKVLSSGKTIPALKKDETVEYSITNLDDIIGDLKLGLTPENNTPNLDDLLEVVITNEQGEIVQRFTFTTTDILRRKFNSPRTFPEPISAQASLMRIKYLGQDVAEYKIVPPSSSDPDSLSTSIDGRQSVMEVVGYFGSSKRKLKLALDRLSGSVLPLFDFVLFSEQGNITPP